MRAVIQVRDLGKCYKLYHHPLDRLWEWCSFSQKIRHRDFWALQGVSFSVQPGESWGIIGENGAGKSTLLKLIAGVTRPSQGQVEVQGRVGALLELGMGFHPEYSGRENIYFSAAMMGLAKLEVDALMPEILTFSGLGEFIDRPVKTYSSGMFTRLGFSVATSINPEVLITDEVLAVGDEAFQKKCIRRMEGFLGQGKSMLFCSHSMYHVRKLCQKAVWLEHGRVRAVGEAAEVANSYEDFIREREARVQQQTEAEKAAARSAPLAADGGEESAAFSRLRTVRVCNVAGDEASVFHMGDTIRIQVEAETGDGFAPIIAIGMVRNDKTAIYGIFSDIDRVTPRKIDERAFAITYEMLDLSLLPGSYTFRIHVLDPPGLRLFDTIEKDFLVRGDTRELGICRMPHRWIVE
ncbi:MAG: ABC transporter ATP-binding protein [Deltaproteobacteria bacterium]|nr:ABC transporter ATP-binding protein [Deltaproteobacteria bacterium]